MGGQSRSVYRAKCSETEKFSGLLGVYQVPAIASGPPWLVLGSMASAPEVGTMVRGRKVLPQHCFKVRCAGNNTGTVLPDDSWKVPCG